MKFVSASIPDGDAALNTLCKRYLDTMAYLESSNYKKAYVSDPEVVLAVPFGECYATSAPSLHVKVGKRYWVTIKGKNTESGDMELMYSNPGYEYKTFNDALNAYCDIHGKPPVSIGSSQELVRAFKADLKRHISIASETRKIGM